MILYMPLPSPLFGMYVHIVGGIWGVDVFTFLGSWLFQNINYYTSIQFDPRPKRGRWFAHHTTSSRERKLQRKINNGAQPSQSAKEAAAKFAFFCYFCVLISKKIGS